MTLLLLILAGISLILVGYDAWFRIRDQKLEGRAETAFSKIAIPPEFKLQGKEYISGHSWSVDYNPRLIVRYELTTDTASAYSDLKQALIDACGNNTPDQPYNVAGDEEGYTYISASCNETMLTYELAGEKNATIVINP